MKLAVIDIGSNAIRFQVSSATDYQGEYVFKKIEYVRFPLRLGHDVFNYNEIGAESEAKFIKLMHAYKLLIELYEVDDYMICATSAMREAKNADKIVRKVYDTLGLKIEIIEGEKEAEIISQAIVKHLDDRNFLHIDVGGGSTELNLYVDRQKVAMHSFKMGSVRRLENTKNTNWKEIEDWINSKQRFIKGELIAVGTGGNINKIFEFVRVKDGNMITLSEIERTKRLLASYSLTEMKMELKLNDDRADVIIPATEIYLEVMKIAGAKKMLVPDVGLKDGMLKLLLERQLAKKNGKEK
ncbi:Ppx/GppA phosphatase family protein [Thermoflexibacter ruber]|uniref:Exopolyphosphatase / guanosine-5'-triphosphate,3'-diphosphate pyrophosphatase n=1 Tax=Thermoflexibacter ruber TaxID=1003 RepID=A0A1I2CTK5_9BACT|nr:phosphatase [Thermoflexibacter ruber]SFE71502.1 exopolyphosphatase / guanosine-5'-triphosphate,3'-diphosphate pyrophosphatase [Thermoflexibacter ruber]